MATALAANLLRLSSSRSASQAASFIPRRGLAGAADHHGPPKVDFWKDPMSHSVSKEDLFVIISFTALGSAIFGGYKAFSGGKKKDEVNQSRLDEIIPINKTMKLTYCSKIEVGPAGTTIEFKELSREALAEEVGPVIPPVVQKSVEAVKN